MNKALISSTVYSLQYSNLNCGIGVEVFYFMMGFLKPYKNGCYNASSTFILKYGLNWRSCDRKSRPEDEMAGNRFCSSILGYFLNDLIYLKAASSVMKL